MNTVNTSNLLVEDICLTEIDYSEPIQELDSTELIEIQGGDGRVYVEGECNPDGCSVKAGWEWNW